MQRIRTGKNPEQHDYDGVDSDMEKICGEFTDDETEDHPLPADCFEPPPQEPPEDQKLQISKQADHLEESVSKTKKYSTKSSRELADETNSKAEEIGIKITVRKGNQDRRDDGSTVDRQENHPLPRECFEPPLEDELHEEEKLQPSKKVAPLSVPVSKK